MVTICLFSPLDKTILYLSQLPPMKSLSVCCNTLIWLLLLFSLKAYHTQNIPSLSHWTLSYGFCSSPRLGKTVKDILCERTVWAVNCLPFCSSQGTVVKQDTRVLFQIQLVSYIEKLWCKRTFNILNYNHRIVFFIFHTKRIHWWIEIMWRPISDCHDSRTTSGSYQW